MGRKLAMVAACLAITSLSVRSFVRSSDWVTPETFYRRTLLAGGTSVRMAVNLAAIYSLRGENARAESILRKVLHVDPSYLAARNNLGSALSAQGKTAEAEKMYDSASTPSADDRENFPELGLLRLTSLTPHIIETMMTAHWPSSKSAPRLPWNVGIG